MPLLLPRHRITVLSLLAALWLTAPAARAILFYDTGSSSQNISAPTGTYAGSGWQYEGYFGSYLGTMISPTHFLTAQHFGVNSGSFVYDTIFSGASTQTFAVDTTVNGGTGYWDISGTDLRVYQITGGTFSTYASLYTGSADSSASFVDVGRGGPRGADVTLAGVLKGWSTTSGDGVARWGRNAFTGTVSSSVGTLLAAHFDAVPGQDEFTLSGGDSGGGAFINDAGVWKLAGINYSVDLGPYSTSPAGTSPFNAALFDRSGYFENSGAGWIPVTGASSLYLSRISDSAAQIQGITGITPVPEPSGALLLLTAAVLGLARRKRAAA